MKKLLKNQKLLLFSRSVFAFVFIFAGIEKIINPADFSISIQNYRLLPLYTVNFIAITLPWLELVSGILLLFGNYNKENTAILCSLLVIFTFLIIISMIRGLNIDCGCFGSTMSQKAGWGKIIENFFLLLLGLHVVVITEHQKDVAK